MFQVAESDRMSYVGSNFGPGSLQCNNICKYVWVCSMRGNSGRVCVLLLLSVFSQCVLVLDFWHEVTLILHSYFVGILDKETMQMKVQRAQLFNLQPIIPGTRT